MTIGPIVNGQRGPSRSPKPVRVATVVMANHTARVARLIGTYTVSDIGSFSITANGSGLAISLKEGVSEPLYASAPDTYFILSNDLVLRVKSREPEVLGRLVMGSFDWPFARETDAKP